MLVGWSLPAWPGGTPVIRYRAAWKSSSAICDMRSED